MKGKNRRSHGAVTVFLTLILVPCMIFVCAFGDVSRVRLSRAQAAAASDLALYSLMANYDENLKEWYGLVASCQDIDSFYKTSQDYFKGMMNANGLDEMASQTFVAYIDAVMSGDFADFLQVEGLDGVEVKPVENGTMGDNPALIEDGIVEFMKYRGPVVIVENMVQRFNELKPFFAGLLEADQNKPIVDAKQEYAEKEGEMMNELLYSYLAMKQYMTYRADNKVPVFKSYTDYYGQGLEKIYKDFAVVTDLITKYYAATDGIEDISGKFPRFPAPDADALSLDNTAIYYYDGERVRHTYTLTGTDHSMTGSDGGIGATRDDENDTYYFTDAALQKLTEKIDDHIQRIHDAAGCVENACKDITVPTADNGVNPAVYCMRIQKAISTSDLNTIKNDGKALMQTVAKLYLAQCWDMPEGSDWGRRLDLYINDLVKVQKEYLSPENPSSEYERILNAYMSVAQTEVPRVKNRAHRATYSFVGFDQPTASARQMELGQQLAVIKNECSTLSKHLEKQIQNIDLILNGGTIVYPKTNGKEYTVPSLDGLKVAIRNFSKARGNWGDEAKRQNTGYAQSEQNEYNNPPDGDKLARDIAENGEEAVEILRTRLTNIRKDMVSLKDTVDNFTYGGVKVSTLDTAKAIAAAKTVVPATVDPSAGAHISLLLRENENAAKDYYARLITAPNYQPPVYVAGESGNEPDLDKDSPSIYKYLHEKLKDDVDKGLSEKENQEKENKENKEKAENEAKTSKGVEEAYLNDLGIDPKETSGSNSFGIGTVLTGLIGAVQTIIDGNFDEFRDEIYVVSYAMEMFSWSSYNNEGQFRLARQKYNTKENMLTLRDFDTSKKEFKAKEGNDFAAQWKNEELEFTNNKSLTNRYISSKNNRSNLAEIEYLLYGKATAKENLETAYAQIFGIRECLNLLSGFQYYYTDPTIQAIAAAVMAATMGLIPEAVTKVVMIGLMATLETVHDLKRLKAGIPVAVYKGKDDWFCAFSGKRISSIFESGGRAEVSDPGGIYYSEYLLIFLFMSCQDKNLYSDILLRIGDLVEGNVEKMNGTDYDLEKAQCYFQLTGKLQVKPLLLKLPLVTNYKGADAGVLLESTDWCTYKLDEIRGYS